MELYNCCKPLVVKAKVSDVRIQMLVFSDFENGCMQGSFLKRTLCWALMHATRKAILTDARNGLLGNGCAQGMWQIPDARNLHCGQPL